MTITLRGDGGQAAFQGAGARPIPASSDEEACVCASLLQRFLKYHDEHPLMEILE